LGFDQREGVYVRTFLNSSPFGNSDYIPLRSYFSGGSNDNRPKPYSLGPDAVEQKMILTKQIWKLPSAKWIPI
jgi:hypothetical protein